MIMSLFRRSPRSSNQRIVTDLYEAIVAAAREPVLYERWGIPDMPLGRFESLGLHMIVFLHRTRGAGSPLEPMTQDVLAEFFRDIDHSIRELGVGDPSVPKRMKKLARMFYGRMEHYWKALDRRDHAALSEAVARNITREDGAAVDSDAIAAYMLDMAVALAAQTDKALLAGLLSFPEPKDELIA